jgi:hypothetical protein
MFRPILFACLAVAGLGCSHYRAERSAAETTDVEALVNVDPGVMEAIDPPADSGLCPVPIEGATVTARDLPDGVALDFDAAPSEVDAVRVRAREMAELPSEPNGLKMGGGHSDMFESAYLSPTPATARVDDTPTGARITFWPKRLSDLEALRVRARARAPVVPLGDCPVPFPRQEPAATGG